MMDYDKYKNQATWPNAKDYTTAVGLDMAKAVRGEDPVIFRKPLSEFDAAVDVAPHVEKVLDKTKYNEAQAAYYENEAKMHALFKKDLFDEYGVSDAPKREKAFSIAWDRGHSGGFPDVASCFSSLAELIQDDRTEELKKLAKAWRADGKEDLAERFADELEQVLGGKPADEL